MTIPCSRGDMREVPIVLGCKVSILMALGPATGTELFRRWAKARGNRRCCGVGIPFLNSTA